MSSRVALVITLTLAAILVTALVLFNIRKSNISDPQITATATPLATQQPTETPESEHPLIRVTNPTPESTITSPLTITGEAKGFWYFEGVFPVTLTNWDGLIIAEGFATAQGEWMTEDFVPFSAELEFEPDTTVSDRATLILQKSNPSGLPEHDDAYEITVYFE